LLDCRCSLQWIPSIDRRVIAHALARSWAKSSISYKRMESRCRRQLVAIRGDRRQSPAEGLWTCLAPARPSSEWLAAVRYPDRGMLRPRCRNDVRRKNDAGFISRLVVEQRAGLGSSPISPSSICHRSREIRRGRPATSLGEQDRGSFIALLTGATEDYGATRDGSQIPVGLRASRSELAGLPWAAGLCTCNRQLTAQRGGPLSFARVFLATLCIFSHLISSRDEFETHCVPNKRRTSPLRHVAKRAH